ncbi:MAG TPA: hypothetical protein VHC43_13610 [Mycobacteriales bacterium]|nr:hypothetical protein [Mycobacteriales bacterium]
MAGGQSFDARLKAVSDGLERLTRRLRSFSTRSWQTRRGAAQVLLEGLVALDAELERRALQVPAVADHVFADAITVVGEEVLAGLRIAREEALLARAERLVEQGLAATR